MKYIIPLLILILMSGCTPTPQAPLHSIYKGQATCAMTPSQWEPVLSTVIASQAWSATKTGKSSLLAIRSQRDQFARIAISYANASYYLSYLDSGGMHYDGTTIDITYEQWLLTLQQAINAQLISHCETIPLTTQRPKPKPIAKPLQRIHSPLFIETIPEDLQIVN